MKSLKKALAKNKTLKVLKMDDVTNGDEVEEIFEQLGKALAVSTSLEEFSFLDSLFENLGHLQFMRFCFPVIPSLVERRD